MTLLLIICATIFNICAQYLLKSGVVNIRFEYLSIEIFKKMVISPFIWIGAFSYGLSFAFYILALSRGELSRISPISQTLVIVGVVVISIIFFHEPLSIMKVIGLGLLIVGTYILFYY
jgi:uncharacterized membrane protein